MISNGEGLHYIVTKSSPLLRVITSKHDCDYLLLEFP